MSFRRLLPRLLSLLIPLPRLAWRTVNIGIRISIGLRKAAVHIVVGLFGIGVVTLVCYPLHLEFAIPAFLYLLVVVVLSLVAGFTPAAITSMFGVACLAYFFIPPVPDVRIADPLDGVALVTYLLVNLIITRLASEAENKRRDLVRLYQAAYRLLATQPRDVSSLEVLRIIREVFEVNAVCLFEDSTGKLEIDGESAHGLAERTRKCSLLVQDNEDRSSGTFIRCLNVAGEPIGAVGFEGLRDADSLSGPLSVLAGSMLERAQSFAAGTTAAATAQAEVMRTSVLNTVANQFNTPLAAILSAAGGIREAGPLVPLQLQMVETIEKESIQLGLLTTCLLSTAEVETGPVSNGSGRIGSGGPLSQNQP